MPQMEHAQLVQLLKKKCVSLPNRAAEDLFTGILHNRLGKTLVKIAGISMDTPMISLTDSALSHAAETAKAFEVRYAGTQGMDCAQVTAGGIATADFDPYTLESRLAPGVYACGEVLDIDGDCGGFNLQWAWSSGRLAGLSASGEAEQ